MDLYSERSYVFIAHTRNGTWYLLILSTNEISTKKQMLKYSRTAEHLYRMLLCARVLINFDHLQMSTRTRIRNNLCIVPRYAGIRCLTRMIECACMFSSVGFECAPIPVALLTMFHFRGIHTACREERCYCSTLGVRAYANVSWFYGTIDEVVIETEHRATTKENHPNHYQALGCGCCEREHGRGPTLSYFH